MNKSSVVLTIAAALVLLLGGPSGASSAPAGSLPNQPASVSPTVAAAGGKGVLTIPAAAFTFFGDEPDYENHARYLIHHDGFNGYVASVQLPHGATVTRMTMHYYNSTALDGVETELHRSDLRGGGDEMASVLSVSAGGYGSVSTDAIAHATVDNAHYAYHVNWLISPSINEVRGCAVTIEYSYPAATPSTDYLSFSSAAFTPFEDGYDFERKGYYLRHWRSPGGGMADGQYRAPVYLPDGATVTRIKFYWYDQTTTVDGHGLAKLQRTQLGQGNYEDMGSANTWWVPGGYWDSDAPSITGATIDNSQYAYWVIWVLPASSQPNTDARGCGILIEYNYQLYLPLVLRNY